MPTRLLLALAVTMVVSLFGCADAPARSPLADGGGAVPLRAEDVRPVGEGMPAPTAVLRNASGAPLDLAVTYAQAPTLLIFYRGGWCPFCSAHLGEIASREDELRHLGVQILGVSPDRPEKLRESIEDRTLGYQLLSDSDMRLTSAFGLAFRVADDEVARYAGAGFDLEEASGHDHHLLPVPAVYLIDTQGRVRFAHWDPDYRQRIAFEELLAEVRELTAGAR
jgi:peroxiredoxin